jgi:demethylmenaquinone methyltransferase/2-methoxy-6-polyprenyl-1,4-benzoquinol methylase
MSRERANVFYRRNASGYDASAARTMVLRRRTIEYLALQPGDAVLDAGCGTGLSFSLLLDRTGPAGSVIGVEASPDMLALARARCAAASWQNVTLIEADLERVVLPRPADAVLFNYTHDVMRSAAALANVFRQTRAGARIAAAGIKHPPRWLDPFRLYRRFKSRGCYERFEGLDTPWDLLAREVPDLRVESTLFGTGYIAWGHLTGRRTE